MGSDWLKYKKLFNNCYCSNCEKGNSSIVDYEIYVNDINDIILRGKCAKCNKSVSQYTETGEDPKYVKRITNLFLSQDKS